VELLMLAPVNRLHHITHLVQATREHRCLHTMPNQETILYEIVNLIVKTQNNSV
jgi:hypothetical protein